MKQKMQKSSGNKSGYRNPKQGRNESREGYKDRNIAGMNPMSAQEQFKPTDAEPVSMHKKMAGC